MRDSKGNKINLEDHKAKWEAKGLSPSVYLTKAEARVFQEDFGTLVKTLPDGTEIRRHAYLLDETRGGSKVVVCNRVIRGNPQKYKEYLALPEEERKRLGFVARWWYTHDKDLEAYLNPQLFND